MSESYLGEIRMVGFNFSPVFWSHCNGGLVAISQNSALFAVMGTHYGGDGRVSMGLPNLVGRAPLHHGYSTGPGQPSYFLGEKGGLERVVLNNTNLPVHKHEIYTRTGLPANTVDTPSTATNLAGTRSGTRPFLRTLPGVSQSLTALEVLKSNGSNLSAPNQQPYTVTNFIISMNGMFPSRN